MLTPQPKSWFRAAAPAAWLLCLSAPLLALDTTPPQFLTPPVLHGPPVRACPLVATFTFTTDEPTRAEIGFRTHDRVWSVIAERTHSTDHTTLVLGMRPHTQHEIRLRISDLAGNTTEWPLRFYHTTPNLPSSFPPLQVVTNAGSAVEPGLTLLPARFSSPTIPGAGTFVILLDEEGEVVWYFATRAGLRDVSRMRNGNLLCLNTNRDAFELDLLGRVVQRWWAANLGTTGAPAGATMVAADTFHHEFSELPVGEMGDFIALSSSHRQFPNYPISETDPTQTQPVGNVAGDVIVEFRRDGSVVRSFDVIDALDPYRLCYNSLAPIYGALYGTPLTDWGHSNAVIVDQSDDSWIVSLRHQDAVVKIRRSDHSVVWIHGAHDRWNAPWSQKLLQPIGSVFQWQFHQHQPNIDPTGRLTLFDNGNYRVIPPTPAPPSSQWYSRAVTYQIDPIAMITQEVWEWSGGGQPFLSGSLGSAYPQPGTSNVLLTAGNIQVTGMNKSYARVQEVSPATPSVLQMEVTVNPPTGPAPNPFNWNVYRARRVSSIYPHL